MAEKAFNSLRVDRFLLEYDTERAGGFEPLRFMPKGVTVVLGIISSKEPEVESIDALVARIDEASRYVAVDDLAISPQCGFASTQWGNLVTWDDQRRKLELVAETARASLGLARLQPRLLDALRRYGARQPVASEHPVAHKCDGARHRPQQPNAKRVIRRLAQQQDER